MDRILIISGHDFRSPRKANIHFIAQELAKIASVRFLSMGFSNISLIKGDPRLELAGQAKVAKHENGVECFLWKTFVHPCNIRLRSLRWLERAHFRYYRSRLPKLASSWMRDAGTVIVESGLGVAFIELIRQISPNARIIYNASDDLAVLGCAPFLLSELDRVAGCLDWARVPSRALARGFAQELPLYFIPHGIDFRVWDQEDTSPYEAAFTLCRWDQCFLMKASSYRRHICFPKCNSILSAREEPAVRFRARTFMFTGR